MAAKRVKFSGNQMTIEDETDVPLADPSPEEAASGSPDPAGASPATSTVVDDAPAPVAVEASEEASIESAGPHPGSLDGLATLLDAGTKVSREIWRLPADAVPEAKRRWLTVSRVGGEMAWAMPRAFAPLLTQDDLVATDWEILP